MWEIIEEDVEKYLKREIASRPVRKVKSIDFRSGYNTDEERECSWLISKWSQGVYLNRDEKNGNYILFIQPDKNLEAIALEFENAEDVKRVIDKIILNVQIAKTFGRKMEVLEGERICLEGVTEYADVQVATMLVRDESQILLDGKSLETTRKAGDILLEYANVGQNGENVLDFQAVGYMDSTQVCLAKRLYDEQFFLTDEQKKGIIYYKKNDFTLINDLLRGGEENYNRIIDICLKFNKSLSEIVKHILSIESIAKALPQRKYDIILNRKGSGFGKSIEEKSENKYDSFVSFATNEGLRTGGLPGGKVVAYQCLLKKDDPVIPIEILVPYVLKGFYPECEFLALPFSYEVEKNIEKKEAADYGKKSETLVVMGNKKNNSVKDILEVRLQELRRHLERLAEDRSYINNVLIETQSIESTERYREQGYIEDEEVEQISLLEILNQFQENDKIKDVIGFDKKIQSDPNQYDSYTHGKNHTRRVGFFARIIGENMGLSENDMKVLLYAVQNHDIGREHDWEDKDHGTKSVEKLKQIRKENNSDVWGYNKEDYFNKNEIDLIYFMIENHSKSARENEYAIRMLPEAQQDRYRLMLSCLKDADKLDRIRLGKYDGLDATRLELPFSKKMVRMAYEVNEVWTDIVDKLSVKFLDIYSFMMNVDEAEKTFQDLIQNPTEIDIERGRLEYYDDSFIIGDVAQERKGSILNEPEKCLNDIIKKSEKQTSMSAINRIITNIKNRVLTFFKGEQKTDKSKDVK